MIFRNYPLIHVIICPKDKGISMQKTYEPEFLSVVAEVDHQ